MSIFLLAVPMAALVEVKQQSDHLEITIGGQPFTSYYFVPEVAKSVGFFSGGGFSALRP